MCAVCMQDAQSVLTLARVAERRGVAARYQPHKATCRTLNTASLAQQPQPWGWFDPAAALLACCRTSPPCCCCCCSAGLPSHLPLISLPVVWGTVCPSDAPRWPACACCAQQSSPAGHMQDTCMRAVGWCMPAHRQTQIGSGCGVSAGVGGCIKRGQLVPAKRLCAWKCVG